MNRRLARLIAFAEVLEREVELLEVLALRGWSKHVVFNKAVEALDATLFVALRRSGELHFERQATAERSKRLVLFAVAATQDARDRRLGVIEEPDARNTAECTTAPKTPAKSATWSSRNDTRAKSRPL